MSGSQSLTTFAPTEYEIIESAMSESARGRWFLTEFARRNRTADTDMLIGAMARLEDAVTAGRGQEGIGHLRGDLMDMANAISRTKAEIAAISAPDQDQNRLSLASEALDAIVRATERATSDILGAAEQVQETAWILRERGVEDSICDDLDRHATQIYTACSFQDLTAQRTGRIVHTLRYLEERLTAMIAIWGDEADRVPPAPGEAAARPASEPKPADLCQSDVDRYIAMDGPTPSAAVATVFPAPISLEDDIVFREVEAEPEPGDAPAVLEAEDILDDAAEPAEPEAEPGEPEPGLSLHDILEGVEEPDFALLLPQVEIEPQAEPETPPAAKAVPAPPTALSFDDIDALSIEEKIALFS